MIDLYNNIIFVGMSENDFMSGSYDQESRYGSVGKLFANIKVKIVDDDGKNLGPNDAGEIYDSDGWMCTGDLGYFDDDGFLFIVGRKKDLLKFNNYQVYPSEIEELIDSIDGVESSCVVGVLDEKTGNDKIFAFVKKVSSTLKEDEILNFVNSNVIDAKKLRGGVYFVESFPLTPSGKVKKNEMRKIAEGIL
jgi:4-coumarate--CoA ligase